MAHIFEADSKDDLRKDGDVVCKYQCHVSGNLAVYTEVSASNTGSLVSACM